MLLKTSLALLVLLCASPEANAQRTRQDAAKALLDALSQRPTTTVSTVAELIRAGADVNAVGWYGNTPLVWACRVNPNPDVVTVLIQHGAVAKSNLIDLAQSNNAEVQARVKSEVAKNSKKASSTSGKTGR